MCTTPGKTLIEPSLVGISSAALQYRIQVMAASWEKLVHRFLMASSFAANVDSNDAMRTGVQADLKLNSSLNKSPHPINFKFTEVLPKEDHMFLSSPKII